MKSALAIICFVSLCQTAVADDWTVDDVLLAEQADYTDLSRDGKLAVWVKTQMDKQKGEAASNLFLTNLAENFTIQLTRGSDAHSEPRFSPDGRRIAFLSTRKTDEPGRPETGGPQIWLIETRGGEPWQLTTFQKGVRVFEWIDDGTLLAAADEDDGFYELHVKARKDTSMVVEDEEHAGTVRLFQIDVKGGTTRRLTENSDRIEKLAVSPDGAYVVTVHDRSLRYEYDSQIKPVTFLHDLRMSNTRQLLGTEKLVPSRIAWAPDSRGFYFSAPHSSHPTYLEETIQRLYYCDRESGRVTEVDLNWEPGLASGRYFAPTRTTDGFVALLANGVKPRAARYLHTPGGWKRDWIESPGKDNILGLQLAADGRTMVYRHSTSSVPEQWSAATLEQNRLEDVRPLTELNASWKQKTIAKTEVAHWNGARDEQVEGIVYYPHGYVPSRKYPLVTIQSSIWAAMWPSGPSRKMGREGPLAIVPIAPQIQSC